MLMEQEQRRKQTLGGFLLYAAIGSSLNWIIMDRHIELIFKEHDIHLEMRNSFLVLAFNIGLLARLLLNRCIPYSARSSLTLFAILLYSTSLVFIAFCDQMPIIVNILPYAFVTGLGLIFIDPLERIGKNDFIDQETHVCILISGLSFGWLIFCLFLTLIFNPTFQPDPQPEIINIRLGLIAYAIIVFTVGSIGVYFGRTNVKVETFEELELTRNRFELNDYAQQSLLQESLKPLRHLKDSRFYFLTTQLYLMYSPSLSLLAYANVKEQQHIENQIYFILMASVGTGLGSLAPSIFPTPYSVKPAFAIIQILMMLGLQLMGLFHSIMAIEFFCLFVEFFLLGLMISLGVLLIQALFEQIPEVLPMSFISISAAVLTQYGLFNRTHYYRGVLLAEFSLVVIAFVMNLLLSRRYQQQ